MKHELTVHGMTCGGCVKSVQKAIAQKDPSSQTTVNLETKKVVVVSSLSMKDLIQTISDAGFQPEAPKS